MDEKCPKGTGLRKLRNKKIVLKYVIVKPRIFMHSYS